MCDFKDMTVCTHDGGLYSTTSRFYPRSDDICHLSPPFSHGRRCAIGYLGLTLRAWQGSRLPHTSSDRDTTLTHSTLPRPDSLRARDAVRNPAWVRPAPVEANQRSNCNSKIILSLRDCPSNQLSLRDCPSNQRSNCNSKILLSRFSHGAPCCGPGGCRLCISLHLHPAVRLLRAWRLQTLHLAASREDRLQIRHTQIGGDLEEISGEIARGDVGEIWASVIRSGDDAPGLSVGTCSAQRLEPLAPHDPFPAALDHNESTCMQGGRCNQHARREVQSACNERRWIIMRAPACKEGGAISMQGGRCNQKAKSGVGSR